MNIHDANSAQTSAAEAAIAYLLMADMLRPIIELAAGYRKQLEDAGFGPAVSEVMAADVHSMVAKLAMAPTIAAAIAKAQQAAP
jgi:hypothetical protein